VKTGLEISMWIASYETDFIISTIREFIKHNLTMIWRFETIFQHPAELVDLEHCCWQILKHKIFKNSLMKAINLTVSGLVTESDHIIRIPEVQYSVHKNPPEILHGTWREFN
jgi:hypothetical protein